MILYLSVMWRGVWLGSGNGLLSQNHWLELKAILVRLLLILFCRHSVWEQIQQHIAVLKMPTYRSCGSLLEDTEIKWEFRLDQILVRKWKLQVALPSIPFSWQSLACDNAFSAKPIVYVSRQVCVSLHRLWTPLCSICQPSSESIEASWRICLDTFLDMCVIYSLISITCQHTFSKKNTESVIQAYLQCEQKQSVFITNSLRALFAVQTQLN